MDGSKNTTALILKREPYRENDSLVTVYTLDFGKLSLIARGTRKLRSKLAGHLEPLTLSEIMIISGKGLDYIGSALGREVYQPIRQDLNKLHYAGRAISIFSRLVKDSEPDRRLFFLIVDWLAALNSFEDLSSESGDLLLAFFALRLLGELGYKPEMYKCLDCGKSVKPGRNYFNLLNGGVVCEACFLKESGRIGFQVTNILTISDNCVKIVRFILENEEGRILRMKIDKKYLKELSFLVESLLNFYF